MQNNKTCIKKRKQLSRKIKKHKKNKKVSQKAKKQLKKLKRQQYYFERLGKISKKQKHHMNTQHNTKSTTDPQHEHPGRPQTSLLFVQQ